MKISNTKPVLLIILVLLGPLIMSGAVQQDEVPRVVYANDKPLSPYGYHKEPVHYEQTVEEQMFLPPADVNDPVQQMVLMQK